MYVDWCTGIYFYHIIFYHAVAIFGYVCRLQINLLKEQRNKKKEQKLIYIDIVYKHYLE